jgi:N-acetylmuramoyl-L-alanine amidase
MLSNLKNPAIFLAIIFMVALTASNTFAKSSAQHRPTGPIKMIVIDPGHGGNDSGARGPRGLKEKDVTLAVAKLLKTELEKRIDAEVVLTRTTDKYLDLYERTDVANNLNADLFISVHVNAAYRKGAKGVETFFLNLEASDDEARKLAAFENNVSDEIKASVAEAYYDEATIEKSENPNKSSLHIEGVPELPTYALSESHAEASASATEDLSTILWDLTQTESHHQSAEVAEIIQESLIREIGGNNRGIKQAPFHVLIGATMPAVLIEMGFISNPKEARKLGKLASQKKIATAIARGVLSFEKKLRKRNGYVNVSAKGRQ